MDVLIASAILIAAVVASLIAGISTVPAFLLGLVLYVLVSLKRGFAPKDVLKMVWSGAKQSFAVVEILLLIGILTGVWRA
ncbi:MAG: Na+/H+ antiporter NhaC family protein, partial [Clostridia bacterium]|nr:Na+/H+ antiporter NhaC family protein [Clostridia bacterium]